MVGGSSVIGSCVVRLGQIVAGLLRAVKLPGAAVHEVPRRRALPMGLPKDRVAVV